MVACIRVARLGDTRFAVAKSGIDMYGCRFVIAGFIVARSGLCIAGCRLSIARLIVTRRGFSMAGSGLDVRRWRLVVAGLDRAGLDRGLISRARRQAVTITDLAAYTTVSVGDTAPTVL